MVIYSLTILSILIFIYQLLMSLKIIILFIQHTSCDDPIFSGSMKTFMRRMQKRPIGLIGSHGRSGHNHMMKEDGMDI